VVFHRNHRDFFAGEIGQNLRHQGGGPIRLARRLLAVAHESMKTASTVWRAAIGGRVHREWVRTRHLDRAVAVKTRKDDWVVFGSWLAAFPRRLRKFIEILKLWGAKSVVRVECTHSKARIDINLTGLDRNKK
jgi:hypothetical protein